MNRLDEYNRLIQELDTLEYSELEVEKSYERANKRYIRRNRILRSVVSTVGILAAFVFLVNVSVPVAQACSRIPVLRELAEAVTFSPSLTDAVENEYAQPIGLVQQDGDVEATIAYVIVDQKQVNVFFSLDSNIYTQMNADPKVNSVDGTAPVPCSYSINGWDIPNGELNCITIDFIEENIPDSLRLQLDIRDFSQPASEEGIPVEAANDYMFENNDLIDEDDYIAHFDFLIEFDPEFTAAGQIYEIDETVVLDGQQIVIESVEIYPTHIRVEISDVPENTAWLKALEFYIETENRQRFDPISNGVTATGSTDDTTSSMVSFRADSSYFYEAKKLKLVITGAEWLRKDMETTYINLKTGETGELPQDVEFYSAEKRSGGWLLSLKAKEREENHYHQILYNNFYDANGTEYEITNWSSTMGEESESGYFIETVPLKDFYDDEVWVKLCYSHLWTAEEPIEVKIK